MTQTSQPQSFEPEGRAIPYVVEGSGPAVVLVPERGADLAELAALAGSLAMEDFRVVRVGIRAATDAETSLAERAQDLVDVLDHVGLAHAWVGGHGFGGTIARQVAVDHHARVSGVVLLGVETAADVPPLAAGIPVLVIQGTQDEDTPPANGEALRASAPDRVSVVAVEGAGHRFPATHVGATSWAIEDYLDWD